MEEEEQDGQDNNRRREENSDSASTQVVIDEDSTSQWLEMSYGSSPLFEMLSRVAPSNCVTATVTTIEGLEVESIQSSPSPSSSSVSSESDDSRNDRKRENHIIWVEPLISCRIKEQSSSEEQTSLLSTSTRSQRPRHHRCGAMRMAFHGPTNLWHNAAMSRRLHKDCRAFGEMGDVGQASGDVKSRNFDGQDNTLGNQCKDQPTTSKGDNHFGQTDSPDMEFGHALNEIAKMGMKIPHARKTPNSLITDPQVNNNHPSFGDECQKNDMGDLTETYLQKGDNDNAIPKTPCDAAAGVSDNENQSQTIQSHTYNSALQSPILVKTIEHSFNNGDNGTTTEQLHGRQTSQSFAEFNKMGNTSRSVATSMHAIPYPFSRGTFQSWLPPPTNSEQRNPATCSKTAWSANVTRDNRCGCGYQSRARMDERCLSRQLNESQNRYNRTSRMTGLFENNSGRVSYTSTSHFENTESEMNTSVAISPKETPHKIQKESGSKTYEQNSLPIQESPSKNRNIKHIITLGEIRDALDIAFQNLIKLDESVALENTVHSETESEKSNSNSPVTTDDLNQHGLISQDQCNALSYSNGNLALNNTLDEIKQDCLPNLVGQEEFIKDPAKNVQKTIPSELLPETSADQMLPCKSCGERSLTTLLEACTRPFGPITLSEDIPLNPGSDNDQKELANDDESRVVSETSDIEQSSKSHTDSTFAIVSLTAPNCDDSHNIASPVQDIALSAGQDCTDRVAGSRQISPELCGVTPMRRDIGGGDGRPNHTNGTSLLGSDSRFPPRSLAGGNLDKDFGSRSQTISNYTMKDDAEVKEAFVRMTSERKSRRNDTSSRLEPKEIVTKAASDSRLRRTPAPVFLNRQNHASDTQLFLPMVNQVHRSPLRKTIEFIKDGPGSIHCPGDDRSLNEHEREVNGRDKDRGESREISAILKSEKDLNASPSKNRKVVTKPRNRLISLFNACWKWKA